MTLPQKVPNTELYVVRYGITTSQFITHVLPLETTMNAPLVGDIQPNVVRMAFSTIQKRIDDTFRAPSAFELTLNLTADTSAALRAKADMWHKILRDAEWFLTSEGTGLLLEKGGHDVNGTGAVNGTSTKITAKMVPADSKVYRIDGFEGVML